MTVRQVTEEEYLRMQNLQGFANRMLGNPESARLLEQAAKIVDPNIRTPRLDAHVQQQQPLNQIQESISALAKRLDDEAAARNEAATIAAANATRDAGLAKLRKAGWNDTGIAKIEQVMTEKGIADPEVAAAYFERIHPTPAPSMPGSNGAFNFNEAVANAQGDDDTIKKLLATRGRETNGLEAISNKMIADTLADIRSGQG